MLTAQLQQAKNSAPFLASATTERKNQALMAMHDAILQESTAILQANAEDLRRAEGKISPVMLDRLMLNPQRIADMAQGIAQLAQLPDPVGQLLEQTKRPNGLCIQKISCPMGVIAIIYESRPNVTADAAALAVKAGSACVLRGGKEAISSAKAIVKAMQKGLQAADLPPQAITLVEDTSRESAKALMEAVGYVDLLIPRGGAGLIRACVENAKVPCIQTGTGICHIYVDKDADLQMALSVLENAKTSRPSVCNAAEVCLVHEDIAPIFLPMLKQRLEGGAHPVELRLDGKAQKVIAGVPAQEADFHTEFLDYILAVGVVGSADEAIAHIRTHSTGHSEAIITANEETARQFTKQVDSAAVYVNCSTRFTDGGQFGLGCEMGISTQKLHARGPMGLRELCSYKYIICGTGQIR